MSDAFNSYESGIQELLERLGQSHGQYAEALTLQSRLLENIAQVRHYGDTETQRAERAQILDALDKLSVESITISFNDLVGSPYGLDITKKVQANDERYLKLAKEQYGTLRTEGLEEIPAPLADVFVMLEVVEALAHKIRTDVLPTHQQAVEMGLKEKQTSAASLRSRLQHSRAEFKPSPAPIPLAEALREHRHLVILGDPGSGKTTALQFIALCLADEELAQERLGLDEVHVPVWVDLRSYDGAEPLGEKLVSAVAALGQFDIVSTQSSQEIAKTLLSDWLSKGRLAVLLDGLDEVPEGQRLAVAEAIAQFSRTKELQSCRVLVTARTAGYRAIGTLDKSFYHYTIRPFAGLEDALPYVASWLRFLTQIGTEKEARDKAQTMLREIKQRGGLQKVVGNPLLLRLAVALYIEGGELPHNRAQLYHQYVHKVLETLERRRKASDVHLSRQQLESVLEAMAWVLHSDIRRTALELSEVIDQQVKGVADGRILVNYLREQLGLIATYGHEQGELINFRHSTFREFFVAQRLALAWKANPKKTWHFLRPRLHHPAWREPILLLAGMIGDIEATRLVRYVRTSRSPSEDALHRDLLLAAAILSETSIGATSESSRVVAAIIRLFGDVRVKRRQGRTFTLWETSVLLIVLFLWGLYTYGLIRSALYMIGEGFSSLPPLSWEQLHAIVTIWLGMSAIMLIAVGEWIRRRFLSGPIGNSRFESLRHQIDETLIVLGQQHPTHIISRMRRTLLHGKPVLWPRAARILNALQATNSQDADHLVDLIKDSFKGHALMHRLLEWFDSGQWRHLQDDPAQIMVILRNLIMRERTNVAVFLRYHWNIGRGAISAAVASLGELGDQRSDVFEVLLTLTDPAEGRKAIQEREQAVRSLGKLRVIDARVLHSLKGMLGSRWLGVDEAAIDSFVMLHMLEPKTVEEALLSALVSDDSLCARNAARALSRLARSQRTEVIWSEMLAHQDPRISVPAARRLQQEGLVSFQTLLALLEDIDHYDTWARTDVMEGLGEARIISDTVISTLILELANVYYSRGHFYEKGISVREAILALLKLNSRPRKMGYKERWSARGAVLALVDLGRENISVIGPALVQALQSGNAFAQEMAAWAIGELGYDVPEAVAVLRHTMESNTRYSAGVFEAVSLLPIPEEQGMLAWLAAAAALGKLGHKSPESIYALLVELESREYAVIRSAAAGLGKIGQGNRHVLRALKETVQIPDSQVMKAAVLALQKLGCNGVSIVKRLLADESITRADSAYSIFERLMAQRTEERVARLPADLPIAKEGEMTAASRTPRTIFVFIAGRVVISAVLGLASNIVAAGCQGKYLPSSDPTGIVISLAVFLISLAAVTGLTWVTRE